MFGNRTTGLGQNKAYLASVKENSSAYFWVLSLQCGCRQCSPWTDWSVVWIIQRVSPADSHKNTCLFEKGVNIWIFEPLSIIEVCILSFYIFRKKKNKQPPICSVSAIGCLGLVYKPQRVISKTVMIVRSVALVSWYL